MTPNEREFGSLLAQLHTLFAARDEILRRIECLLTVVLDEHRERLDVPACRDILWGLDEYGESLPSIDAEDPADDYHLEDDPQHTGSQEGVPF